MIQKTQGRRTDDHRGGPYNTMHWGQWVGDKQYSLEVVQHPVRARMCGFGDKDRRPLAPAAVAKMVVKDRSDNVVPVDEIDVSFFVVTVDLWSEDGSQEMNLVLHPSSADRYVPAHMPRPKKSRGPSNGGRSTAGSPSVQTFGLPQSAAPLSSSTDYNNSFNFSPTHPNPPASGGSGPLNSHGPTATGQLGDPSANLTPYASSWNFASNAPQPQQQRTQPSGSSGAGTSLPPIQSLKESSGPDSSPGNAAFRPWGSDENPFFAENTPLDFGEFYSNQYSYPPPAPLPYQPQSNAPPPHATPMNPPTTSSTNQGQTHHSSPSPPPAPQPPRHQYTRTLVGPLSANACRLQDEHRKSGIFFLFQDLSVRTEGTFRLRMRLMNVGAPPAPEWGSPGVTEGVVNVLAQTYTDRFIVYSAKRFPGVPDTTALSIAFGNQGQKLPLRNRNGSQRSGRRRGSDGEEEDDD